MALLTPATVHALLDAHGAGGRPVTLVHADDPDLRRMCVFDSVVNNADRKGGHVLHGRVLPFAAGARLETLEPGLHVVETCGKTGSEGFIL